MSLLLVASLAGCFGEENSDLKEWMRQSSEGLHGKVEPLSAVKPYEPFPYNASDVGNSGVQYSIYRIVVYFLAFRTTEKK